MTDYLKFFSDYTVLDLETTGLNPQRDEIIEIGAVRVRNSMIMKQFSTLVRPKHSIPEFITDLTGISQEDVNDAPTIREAIGAFLAFVGDDIIVGHNVGFDIAFLNEDHPFSPDVSDTMRLSRALFPKEPHYKLSNLKEWFGIRSNRSHRALDDVLATHRVYLALRDYASVHQVDESGLVAGELEWKRLNSACIAGRRYFSVQN